MPGIYLKHGDAYVAMTETPYDREGVLQALIAQHPEVLADQGPLLLVRREAAVSDEEDAGGRWSLDHLYVDSDGVPTLVEVKRSSDTRGRRDVVAQMLDYAANARTSFSPDRMAAWLEDDAQARGTSAAQALSDALGVQEPDAFWTTVATNLDAERFRLIFVSDVIPPELRRIIEFLNGQMARTEVLAIEVKQYVDDEARHQTIVPHVIGNTEVAKRTKRARQPATVTDRASLLAALADGDPGAAEAAQRLLDWGEEHPDLNVRWTRAGDIGLAVGYPGLLRVWAEGTVEVKVNTLRSSTPRGTTTSESSSSFSGSSRSTAWCSKATGDSGRARRWRRSPTPNSGRRSLPSSPTSSEGWTSRPEVRRDRGVHMGAQGPAHPAEPGYLAHQRRRRAPSSAVRQDLAGGEPRSGALDGRGAPELAVEPGRAAAGFEQRQSLACASAEVYGRFGAAGDRARFRRDRMAAPTREDAHLVIQIAQWGTALGVQDALARLFADDFDPEKADALSDEPVRTMLLFGESIGTLTKHGLLSAELVDDWIWVEGVWARVGPAALRSREKFGEPRLYENFEALATR